MDTEERRSGLQIPEVRNDLGALVLRAKIASYVRPGQIFLYHAWEP